MKKSSSVVEYDGQKEHVTNKVTFGSRLLTDPAKFTDFNAWDHVDWDASHLAMAAERVAFHQANPVPSSELEQFGDETAHCHWDEFYMNHDHKFFKDRKWINIEFPEIFKLCDENAGHAVICDVGCAVGNTVFPILRQNHNPHLYIHALDFSAQAIRVLKKQEEYNSTLVDARVWDMADSQGPPSHIAPGSVDLVLLIFAFSALSPPQWQQAVANILSMLKPGGQVLFRDYGRFDLTQLRLKANRLLQPNFYIRGDKTRMYYFTNEELNELFTDFDITQNAIDKRMLVNRKEGKKMYRAWVQLKATKPRLPSDNTST